MIQATLLSWAIYSSMSSIQLYCLSQSSGLRGRCFRTMCLFLFIFILPYVQIFHHIQQLMQIKQVPQHDVLTNLLIRSKRAIDETLKQQPKYDHKLNYSKVYDNPKQYEVSYVDALANLEEMENLYKKRIRDKNEHYNFFLDDNEQPYAQNPITVQDYEKYLLYLEKGKIFAYTLKNTWTKGKQFFFITTGCILQVVKIYEDRIFVDVQYKGQVGLMKLEQLKIILADDDD